MSGRLSRVAFSTSAVALALVLAAPSAALADDDHGKSGDKGKGGGAAKGDGHNPPGNNGTIKIDYAAPADSGHANRPHPGCAFQLRMFNFDDDQYGTVTFEGQAPTKLGTLLTQTHVLLSDDDAGGGKDVDAVYSYTAEQLGLIGKPQAKQGWHVKVSVDAENAPGGAKHKVFWLDCPPATTTGTTSGTATQGGSTVTTKTTTTQTKSTFTTSGSATAGAVASAAKAAAAGAGAAAVAGSPSAAATGGAGLGATTAEPTALAFTGSRVATMVGIALLALLAGGLAIVAGRRRTSASL